MWLFGRRARALPLPDGLPQIVQGPHLIRRTEITVEREWSSTVLRTGEPAVATEIVVDGTKGDGRD